MKRPKQCHSDIGEDGMSHSRLSSGEWRRRLAHTLNPSPRHGEGNGSAGSLESQAPSNPITLGNVSSGS